MPRIEVTTDIRAPIETCFDLARDIDFHQTSLSHTGERAIAGVTTGLIGLGDSVTWQGRHLGITQRLTVKVADYDHPSHFRDVMTRGAFKAFSHDHFFSHHDGMTRMRDVIDFKSPAGLLGRLINRVYLRTCVRSHDSTLAVGGGA